MASVRMILMQVEDEKVIRSIEFEWTGQLRVCINFKIERVKNFG